MFLYLFFLIFISSIRTEEDEVTMEEFREREMHKATCSDCGQACEVPFKPTEGKSVRCQDCFRKSRPPRSGGSGRFGGRNNFSQRRSFNDGPREMHKAVCAECKQECEVPFKPTEGKPVYCKDCFQSRRNNQEEF